MNQHAPTLLAAISLSLSGLELGDLDPPLDRANLSRLRDSLEIATFLPDAPGPAARPDLETLLLVLMAVRGVAGSGVPLQGAPDLVTALERPRLEAAIRHLMDRLDAPVELVVRMESA